MVFKCLFVLALCTCYGRLYEIFLDKEWEDFKRIYSKTYTEQDEKIRKSIWIQNIDIINRHNKEADMGHHSYRLGMNEFGDMTTKEVTRMLNVPKGYATDNVSTFLPPNNLQLPETVNWTKEGYVTPVKNQGYCGSCWAFATTGGLEGQHFRKTKKLVSLSEQNLVDCCKENLGCTGGLPVTAYKYIARNGGIDTEESYPYLGKLGNVIWKGRLHYDGSKSRQPVWYFKPACVPYCVGQKRFLKKGLSRFVSFLNVNQSNCKN
ncbi:procathepsin L isoform X3 [Magallana gigas]|uniref:procathepsin L isoform X3 n=1 Tax=Magallana gigas TaxID=29159 RepID=UPI00333E72AE